MLASKHFVLMCLMLNLRDIEAARVQDAGNAGGYRCFAFKGTQLCKKAWGEDHAHYARDFEVPEKMCLSKLCDEQKGGLWNQCCTIRDILVNEGVPISDFEYEGAGVIHVNAPPTTMKPVGFNVDLSDDSPKVVATTCASYPRAVHFTDHYSVKFDLPKSTPGVVTLQCGDTAQDPDAEVTFLCGDDLQWQTEVSGSCQEALHCKASSLTLKDTTTGKMIRAHPDLVFELPRQPNKFSQTIVTEVACPRNAKNRQGKAKFSCDGNGEWSLVEQHCTRQEGECPGQPFRVTLGEHEHTYELIASSEGTDIRRTCLFGPLKKGKVHFVCKDGKWSIDRHDCQRERVEKPTPTKPTPTKNSQVAAGGSSCSGVDYTLTLKGDPHVYPLAAGEPSDKQVVACQNGQYTDGTITFECQTSGRWKVGTSSCKKAKPQGTVCSTTNYGISGIAGPDTKVSFRLENSPAGTFQFDCGEGYSGSARFTCATGGKWKFVQEGSKCVPE